MLPPGYPKKNFSSFGPAVWPAIADTYIYDTIKLQNMF